MSNENKSRGITATTSNTATGIFGFDSPEWGFLSNFYPSHVIYEGVCYPTVEHAYQAAKTLDVNERLAIAEQATPGRAKRAGRKVTLRADWEQVKVPIMHALLLSKFEGFPDLARRLQATGDREIVEANDWGDVFWGVSGGYGENMLGKLLMQVRTELRS